MRKTGKREKTTTLKKAGNKTKEQFE